MGMRGGIGGGLGAVPPDPLRRFGGDELRTCREWLGLTQAEFGEKLGVTGRTVYRLEKSPEVPPVYEYASRWLRYMK